MHLDVMIPRHDMNPSFQIPAYAYNFDPGTISLSCVNVYLGICLYDKVAGSIRCSANHMIYYANQPDKSQHLLRQMLYVTKKPKNVR